MFKISYISCYNIFCPGMTSSRIENRIFEIIKNEKMDQEEELTPTIRSLKGILKGKQVDERDYRKYLEEKYL